MNFELTNEQLAAINTNNSRVLVESCAGSGKTAVLTQRLAKLVDDGIEPTQIVAITFTNASAGNMIERLGVKAEGMFIGTIHSYANYLLLSYGIDTSNYLQQENFNALFTLVQKYPNCIKPIKHLLVDEAQDSTQEQFELFELLHPDNFFYVFDFRQSIFRWNGAQPQYIINMIHDIRNTVYHLSGNYRNASSILDYAKSVIRIAGYEYIDYSKPMRDEVGRVVEVEYSSAALSKAIARDGHYKDWFVLCRTNDQVDEMIRALQIVHVPCSSFKRSQLTNEQLYEKMKEDSVKVLTIHTSKGLEAPKVIVIGAKFYNIEERCISYVAATRARDLLVWTKMPNRTKKMGLTNNWET